MSSRHDPTPRTSVASSWTKLLVRKEIRASSGWSWSGFRGREPSEFSVPLSTFSKASRLHWRMKQLFGGIALLLLTAAEPFPTIKPRLVAREATGWPKYCGTASMSGTPTGASSLGVATVPRLTLAWMTSLNGPIASAPSVLGQTLYVGDWGGFETAIEVPRGEVLAQADLGRTQAPQCNPSALGITSSPAIDGQMIYVAGGDDAFYALDRDTLRVIWRKSLGDNSAAGGYYGWSSP